MCTIRLIIRFIIQQTYFYSVCILFEILANGDFITSAKGTGKDKQYVVKKEGAILNNLLVQIQSLKK